MLFRIEIFLASMLLFVVEPMAAKQLLPLFGGSAAVWITCLVFFQIALLAGYLYAHLLARRGGGLVHLSLLLVAVICAGLWAFGGIGMGTWGAGHPVAGIFWSLGVGIGVPFVMLGATSPLLQVWWTRSSGGGLPYGMFGLSNVGSLLALLAYPTVIEPYLALRTQRLVWLVGVVIFAGVSAVISWRVRGQTVAGSAVEKSEWEIEPWRRPLWFVLPMIGAMQLSAVTQYLTVNVAAIPLLWILPLAIYLATFVVAFQSRLTVPRGVSMGLLAVMLVALGDFVAHPGMALPIGVGIGLFLLEVLAACLFCHAELYALRPEGAGEVTAFYLTIAAGGAAGSFLIGIVAPLVFRGNYDLSITFLLTGLVALAICWTGMRQRVLWGAMCVLLVSFAVTLRKDEGHNALLAVRNFYGSLRVTRSVTPGGDEMRTLLHGTITHGTEIFGAGKAAGPTTYYAPDSGVGLALTACCGGRARKIGVIGLGAGTIAAYGRAGDKIRFYEINPAVQPIAENMFTYVRQSGAKVTFVEGDGRAALAGEPAQGFDVLVVDAFSGDAIPLHLLTVQAMAAYRRQLAPGGVLAFHVSNQYLDLEPELAELARNAGLEARGVTSKGDEGTGAFVSTWVLMSADAEYFRRPEFAGRLHMPNERNGVWPWTDDYSSLVRLVRW